MAPFKIIWIINFFFFAFILLFTWSKLYVISRKIKGAQAKLDEIEGLSGTVDRLLKTTEAQPDS